MTYTATSDDYFRRFNFLVDFRDDIVADSIRRLGGDGFPIMGIESREHGKLLLTAAHRKGQRPIIERVWEALKERKAGSKDHVTMHVWFLDRTGKTQRRFDLQFEDAEWLPLDLDASSEGTSLERVVLTGVKYLRTEDAVQPQAETG